MLHKDPCPNCSSTEYMKRTYESKTIGDQVFTIVYCDRCPVVKQAQLELPTMITSKSATKRVDEKKFEAHILSDADIAATQKLKSSVNIKDTPHRRMMDDIHTKRIHVGSDKNRESRNKKVYKELDKEFGGRKYQILKDDGFEVAAKAV